MKSKAGSRPLVRSDRDKKLLGRGGEEIAATYLVSGGYTIVDRNWRCPIGEIDLVAEDESCLVFVEVRTRRGSSLGTPEESITAAKQARLIALAESYVQSSGWPGDWRIDVIAVEMDGRGRLVRLDHYENAVTG